MTLPSPVTYRHTVESDAALLRAWFVDDPEMYGYWGGEPLSDAKIVEKCSQDGDEESAMGRWIVEERGVPIGFVQEWRMRADDRLGFDMVLVPSARGRGLGSAVLQRLAELASASMPSSITVDPQADNARAIRAFGKAGFVPSHDEVIDGVDHLIMRWGGRLPT